MERREISDAGRASLAAAVSTDRDWNLRASAEDTLIEALGSLSDDDLEAAAIAAHILTEAVACVLIRRDTQKLPAEGGHVWSPPGDIQQCVNCLLTRGAYFASRSRRPCQRIPAANQT